ncbi:MULTISPECIES: fimbrial protein [Pseudomonas]|uniref:fimbrial protein n=1 Tax=Pseudomonas TaxID=286 RepID=UPI000BA2FA54|nr:MULTISPECIES: fimbrial protein [Pseudomonas]UVL96836.1 type 1 fimbrial protein [Pseudomonas siliginis]
MKLCRVLIVGLLYMLSSNAMAAVCEFYPDNSMGNMRVILPATLSVPRDAPNGTVIYESPIVTLGSIPSSFRCSAVHNEGVRNNVGVTQPGVEIFPIGNTGIGWQWVRPPSGKAWKGFPGTTDTAGGWGWNGSEHILRFVKTGTISGSATIPSGQLGTFVAAEIEPLAMNTSGTRVVSQSCETPDVKVDMGSYNLSDFPENGASAKEQYFSLNMKNCPTGINNFRFSFSPTAGSPVWDAGTGMVNLNSNSTAKGLALQMRFSDKSTLKLNQNYIMKAPTSQGGNAYVSLQARFVRIEPSNAQMRAGDANAEIAFVVEYL